MLKQLNCSLNAFLKVDIFSVEGCISQILRYVLFIPVFIHSLYLFRLVFKLECTTVVVALDKRTFFKSYGIMSMVQLIYVWLLIIKLHILWYRLRYRLSSVLITSLNEHTLPKQTLKLNHGKCLDSGTNWSVSQTII